MGAGENARKSGENTRNHSEVKMGSGGNTIKDEEDEPMLVKIVEQFVDVFDKDSLPPIDTDPMIIKLKENYTPKAITVPRNMPCARRDDEILEI